MESLENLVDESRLLLIARVVSVERTARPTDPIPDGKDLRSLEPRQMFPMHGIELEPVAWLRGELDGDRIEAVLGSPGWKDLGVTLQQATQVDTMGVLVPLSPSGLSIYVIRPIRLLAEHSFPAVRDSVLHARSRLTLDSLAANADLIFVTRDSVHLHAARPEKEAKLRPGSLIKGVTRDSTVTLRAWQSYHCKIGDVVFARAVGKGVYEPIPFARSGPPRFDLETPGGLTPAEIESALRAALN